MVADGRLLGVLAFQAPCGLPYVFTRVDYYKKWINETFDYFAFTNRV